MRARAPRFLLQLSLAALTGVLVSTPALAEHPLAFEEVLGRVEEIVDTGAASPELVRRSAVELRELVETSEDRVAIELLRQLTAQLEQLAGPRDAGRQERWDERLRAVRLTVDLLLRKIGERRSVAASLTTAMSPPAHDDCASSQPLQGALSGSTIGATVDGASSCGDSALSPDVWYSYTASEDGLVVWRTTSSFTTLDTVLSLHSACPDASSSHELTCDDDSRGTFGSLVAREMSAGESVLLRVSGASGASGDFLLSVDDDGGGIGGSVRKAGTGDPLTTFLWLHDSSGAFIEGIETSRDGAYLFGGLAPGSWYVSVQDPLFLNELWDDHFCPAPCDVVATGDPIAVTEGLVDDIDFDLEAGGTMKGTVTEEGSGSSLSSLFLAAYDGAGREVGVDVTNSFGRYELRRLPAGGLTVRASSQRHEDELFDDLPCPDPCDVTAGTPVQVAAGSTHPDIDFQLEKLLLGSISGAIVSAVDGSPVTGSVVVYDHFAQAVGGTSIESNGTYRVEDLLTDVHFVRTFSSGFLDELYDDVPCEKSCSLFSGTPVQVTIGEETAGIDFVLEELGEIAGTVFDAVSGSPVAVNLRLYRENGDFRAQNASSFDGTFRFRGLDPGSYFVHSVSAIYEDVLYDDIGCDPSCDVTGGDSIPVAASSTTEGVHLSLLRCSAVSDLVLHDVEVGDHRIEEACRTIRAGQEVVVVADGDLVLRAGRGVAFESGFRVEVGGRLEVTVDPSALSP